MSIIRVINETWLLDDTIFTNDPDALRLKYKLDIQETLTADIRIDRSFPAATLTDVGLSGGPFKWIYVATDQPISIRFDANVDDTVLVEPVTNGNLDGIMLKRGAFSLVQINVAGATAARVILLAGV